jgi:hypothetical protein
MAVMVAPNASAARPIIHSQDNSAPVEARAGVVAVAVTAAAVGAGAGAACGVVDAAGVFVIGVLGESTFTAAPVTGAAVTAVVTVFVGHVVTLGAVGVPQLGPLHDAVSVMVPVRSVGSAVTA